MTGTRKMTKKDIIKGLRTLGLAPGDHVLVHSALSSFGHVAGGADAVIDALLEAVAPGGTVLVPTFPDPPVDLFDPGKTETDLGTIPRAFRNRKEAVRSLHPLASVAAIGPKARWFVEGHADARTAHGHGTPYHKLCELNGKVLLLGVDQDRSTFLHMAEALARMPYLRPAKASFIDASGRKRTKTWPWFPGPHRDFIGLQKWLEEAGLTKKTAIGSCVAQLMPCGPLVDALLDRLAADPALFLTDNPNLPDGIEQRADLLRATLSRESFTPAADSQFAGQYMEEIVENLQQFGIDHVVLSFVNDVPWDALPDAKRKWYLRGLRMAKIKVAALKLPILVADKAQALAKEAGAQAIIVPSTAPARAVANATAAGIDVYVENAGITGAEAAGLMEAHEKSRHKARVELAFNPLAFVQVGENPFLGVYSQTRIKRHIGLLYVNDGLATGQRTLLEEGLAEIKELISILRSRSFAGLFVLQSQGPGEFRKTATTFLNMLETLGQ